MRAFAADDVLSTADLVSLCIFYFYFINLHGLIDGLVQGSTKMTHSRGNIEEKSERIMMVCCRGGENAYVGRSVALFSLSLWRCSRKAVFVCVFVGSRSE